MIVLDTSVLIDVLRGLEPARAALVGAIEGDETLAASQLTKVELLRGMRSAKRPAVRRLLGAVRLVPVDDGVAERAGEYAGRFRASHRGADIVDFVIAATADHLGARLWTRNVRRFPMFEGLLAPYPDRTG